MSMDLSKLPFAEIALELRVYRIEGEKLTCIAREPVKDLREIAPLVRKYEAPATCGMIEEMASEPVTTVAAFSARSREWRAYMDQWQDYVERKAAGRLS